MFVYVLLLSFPPSISITLIDDIQQLEEPPWCNFNRLSHSSNKHKILLILLIKIFRSQFFLSVVGR